MGDERVRVSSGSPYADIRPASTMVLVAGLLDLRWLVEVELGAIVQCATPDPSKTLPRTEGTI